MTLALVHPEPAQSLAFVVYGTPQGAARHRSTKTGRQYKQDSHVEAEERVRRAAAEAWAGRPPLDVPVRVEITTWHARPGRLRTAKRWANDGTRPYVGKPDADNVAKLILDGMTKAGVWVDDTRVAELLVRRMYLPLDAERLPVGVERVGVVVEVLMQTGT